MATIRFMRADSYDVKVLVTFMLNELSDVIIGDCCFNDYGDLCFNKTADAMVASRWLKKLSIKHRLTIDI